MARSQDLARWDTTGLRTPEMLLAALAVLAFGRARSWKVRLAALVCGNVAWTAALTVDISLLSPLLVPYAAVAVVVAVTAPPVVTRTRRVNRPETVHQSQSVC